MKKSFLLVTGFVLGIALLIGVFQFFSFTDFLRIFFHLEKRYVLAYICVSFFIFTLLAYRWKIIAKAHGIDLPFSQAIAYRYVGFAVSFVTPGPRVGGEVVRAALLKRHKVKMPLALSSVIADKTIELTSFGAMLILATGFALITVPLSSNVRTPLLLICLFLLGLIVFGFSQMLQGKDPVLRLFKLFRLHKIAKLKKYEKDLLEFEKNILRFYSKGTVPFWKAQVLSALAWSLSLVEFFLIVKMIGVSVTFAQLLLIYSVVGVAYLIPLPLALGVLDAGQASLFAALNLGPASGAFLAMMTRARDLLWTLIGFVILSYYGVDTLKQNDAS